MSKVIYNIYYWPKCNIGKPHGLARHAAEETSGIDTHFYNKVQLLDSDKDDLGKEEDTKDVELEEIDVDICEKTNKLWVLL